MLKLLLPPQTCRGTTSTGANQYGMNGQMASTLQYGHVKYVNPCPAFLEADNATMVW